MDLQRIRSVYDVEGPYVTVHLDTSRSTGDARHEIELRWRAIRESLAAAGAVPASLDAIAAVVLEPTGYPGLHGRFLVAADGRVLLDDTTPEPPSQDWGVWEALPRLLPLLRTQAEDIPYVLAAVDRVTADINVHTPQAELERHLEGGTLHVTKVAVGDWAHPQFQRRSENLWRDNARQVAADVDRFVAAADARVLVVAGDVRARQKLVEQLPPRSASLAREVAEGGHAAGSSDEALDAAVQQVLDGHRRAELGRLYDNYATHASGGLVREGFAGVRAALEEGRVAQLIFHDFDDGVRQPRPSEVLVQLAARTDADLAFAPQDGPLRPRHGVGAILRY